MFLTELRTRSKAFAWTNLLTVVIDGVNKSFIDVYGRITLPEVLTHVTKFIDVDIGDEGRLAQNDYQLFMAVHRRRHQGQDGDRASLLPSGDKARRRER